MNGLDSAYPGAWGAYPALIYPSEITDAESLYGWTIFPTAGGIGGRRKQEQTTIEEFGETSSQLLSRIDAYEAQREAMGIPLDHEWGMTYGTYKRRFLRIP